MPDWPTELVELVRLKQRIAELDVDRIFPFTLPSVAAEPAAVAGLAGVLGLELDAQHSEFLGFADGWRAFFETADLLSVEQLAGGRHVDTFNAWLTAAPPQAAEQGFRPGAMLPVGVDLTMPMFFAMPVSDGVVGKSVYWLDPSGVVDAFASFEEFFASIRKYTERLVADFEQGKYRLDAPAD